MATLFDKIRTVVMGNLHALIDAVIDLNSPQAVRQHIRDLEEGMEKLDESVAEARGQETTARRDFARLEGEWNRLDKQVDAILDDGDELNDNFALPLQAQLDGLTPQVKSAYELVQTADQTADQLGDVRLKLKAKHAAMVAALQRLETLDKAAKAKERAADSLKIVVNLNLDGGQASVDNLAARIQARADKADATLAMALENANTGLNADDQLAATSANLALRKKRLAQNASADSLEAAVAETGTRPAWMDA